MAEAVSDSERSDVVDKDVDDDNDDNHYDGTDNSDADDDGDSDKYSKVWASSGLEKVMCFMDEFVRKLCGHQMWNDSRSILRRGRNIFLWYPVSNPVVIKENSSKYRHSHKAMLESPPNSPSLLIHV